MCVCLSAAHLDLIVLANGHGSNIVFLSQLLGEGGGHDLPADVRRGVEVPLAVLTPRGRDEGIQLHDACKHTHTLFSQHTHTGKGQPKMQTGFHSSMTLMLPDQAFQCRLLDSLSNNCAIPTSTRTHTQQVYFHLAASNTHTPRKQCELHMLTGQLHC